MTAPPTQGAGAPAPATPRHLAWRLLLLACSLAAWGYLDLAGGSGGLAALAALRLSATPSERCSLPPLREVAAAWAARGAWVQLPPTSPPRPHLYSWEEAITIHVGNSERYIDGCGAPAAREHLSRLRWAFNASGSTLPAVPEWSREATCRALRGRNVAVLGDSMSGEFYDALVSALWSGEHGVRPPQRQGLTRICDGREDGTAGAGLNATYTYFDHLGSAADEEASLAATLAELQRALAARPPPILVLNRGAHMHGSNVEPLYPGEAEAAAHARINAAHAARMAGVWAWLAAHAPDSPVFWRTTTVGHAFCRYSVLALPLEREESLDEALAAAQAREAASGGPLRNATEDFPDADYKASWHWDNIPLQNAATLAALPRSVHLLDVAHATALRRDSHPHFKYGSRARQDCLHYCLPGPIDAWVELFAGSVRYGEEGGAEFFDEAALAALCSGGRRRYASRHALSGFGSGGGGGVGGR